MCPIHAAMQETAKLHTEQGSTRTICSVLRVNPALVMEPLILRNVSPENGPSQKKTIVFQPSLFLGANC